MDSQSGLSSTGNSRNTLSLRDKIKLIEHFEKNGTSSRKLAEIFSCGRTQAQLILKTKENLLRRWRQAKAEGHKDQLEKKRLIPYKTKHDLTNSATYTWFIKMREKNLPLNGPILQEKARKIAKDIAERSGDSDVGQSFKASNGWLRNFKQRYGLLTMSVAGESGQLCDITLDCWFNERLKEVISGYAMEDIYNLDETGLFWKALPGQSLNTKGTRCAGGKKSVVRITVLLIANAVGNTELPIVIGKSKSPRCFKNLENKSRPLGIPYYSNSKAWMNSEIFTQILQNFNRRMNDANRNVLLLMDNAPCHPAVELSNVKFAFLPPNTTSAAQPLDAGIIKSFKVEYKRLFLQHIIAKLETHNTAADVISAVDILMAIGWTKEAWRRVKTTTIVNCFKHCKIAPVEQVEDDDDDPFQDDNLSRLQSLLNEVVPEANIEELFPDDVAPTNEPCDDPDEVLQRFLADNLSPPTKTDDGDDIMVVEVANSNSMVQVGVTNKQALAAVNTLTSYGIHNNDAAFLKNAEYLSTAIMCRMEKTYSQKKITAFFPITQQSDSVQ